MKIISEYYGNDLGRKAEVVDQGEYFTVNMYQNEVLVEARDIKDHSEHFAEDCAENWAIGIIKG